MNIFKTLHDYTVVRDAINSGTSLPDVLSRIDAATIDDLEALGGAEFPRLKPELHALAVILETYDPDHTKWLQKALNILVVPSPNIGEDGLYGPDTHKAIRLFLGQIGPSIEVGVAELLRSLLVAKKATAAV